ncbi:hypothetical protein AB4084_35730, partial [Lysobacter sp. 2RAB21]
PSNGKSKAEAEAEAQQSETEASQNLGNGEIDCRFRRNDRRERSTPIGAMESEVGFCRNDAIAQIRNPRSQALTAVASEASATSKSSLGAIVSIIASIARA